VALINVIPALENVKPENRDEEIAIAILRTALEEPLRKIAANAGKDGAVVLDTVRRMQQEKNNTKLGYDVIAEDYVDMVKAGIIDPAKVTKGALENAASIAAMILTTEALVTDLPKKKATPSMPSGEDMY
jgi:chaperonin GroEL